MHDAILGERILVDGKAVDNVLVSPSDKDAKELVDISLPAGHRIYCRLDFPKVYTKPLHGRTVTVRGEELTIVDDKLAYEEWNTPGEWNRYAFASKLVGDYADEIVVLRAIATIDELGDAATAYETIYSGPAQARMQRGDEDGGTALITDSTETWFFVMPWQQAFDGLRPQAASIFYDGATYDVTSIMDVDNAGESASMKAVRRG